MQLAAHPIRVDHRLPPSALAHHDPEAAANAAQQARLAILESFATPLPHDEAARLPLLVLPPARLRLLNPVQALQALLSLQFTRAGHARRCSALAALMPSAEARYAFNSFMLTMLARRIAAGRLTDLRAERRAIEQAWSDPTVLRRWQRLSALLDADDCERLCRLAIERRLAGHAVRWVPPASSGSLFH